MWCFQLVYASLCCTDILVAILLASLNNFLACLIKMKLSQLSLDAYQFCDYWHVMVMLVYNKLCLYGYLHHLHVLLVLQYTQKPAIQCIASIMWRFFSFSRSWSLSWIPSVTPTWLALAVLPSSLLTTALWLPQYSLSCEKYIVHIYVLIYIYYYLIYLSVVVYVVLGMLVGRNVIWETNVKASC